MISTPIKGSSQLKAIVSDNRIKIFNTDNKNESITFIVDAERTMHRSPWNKGQAIYYTGRILEIEKKSDSLFLQKIGLRIDSQVLLFNDILNIHFNDTTKSDLFFYRDSRDAAEQLYMAINNYPILEDLNSSKNNNSEEILLFTSYQGYLFIKKNGSFYIRTNSPFAEGSGLCNMLDSNHLILKCDSTFFEDNYNNLYFRNLERWVIKAFRNVPYKSSLNKSYNSAFIDSNTIIIPDLNLTFKKSISSTCFYNERIINDYPLNEIDTNSFKEGGFDTLNVTQLKDNRSLYILKKQFERKDKRSVFTFKAPTSINIIINTESDNVIFINHITGRKWKNSFYLSIYWNIRGESKDYLTNLYFVKKKDIDYLYGVRLSNNNWNENFKNKFIKINKALPIEKVLFDDFIK